MDDDLINRMRTARWHGLTTFAEVSAHFGVATIDDAGFRVGGTFTSEELFLAWHAAKILDPQVNE